MITSAPLPLTDYGSYDDAAFRSCRDCRQSYPLTEYYRYRTGGLYAICKTCQRQRVAEGRRQFGRTRGTPPLPLPYVENARAGKYRRFTRAGADAIRAAYAAGLSYQAIAAECGVLETTIRAIVRGQTYHDGPRSCRQEQYPAMVCAWLDGASRAEVAARFGCSDRTVDRARTAARRVVGEERWARLVAERTAVRGVRVRRAIPAPQTPENARERENPIGNTPWRNRPYAERYALAEDIRRQWGEHATWYLEARAAKASLRGTAPPYQAIAAAYGTSVFTVHQILHNRTLTTPERAVQRRRQWRITPAERAAVLDAVRAGAQQAAIARAMAHCTGKPWSRQPVWNIVQQARAAGELPPEAGRRQRGRARG